MRTIFLSLTLALTFNCFSQSEEASIRETLNKYLKGSSYNDQEMIREAFYENADLFLSKEGQELWVLTPKEYAALFKNRPKGVFNGRETTILDIDINQNIASAKAIIWIESQKMKFIDMFLLKKLSGQWKIISKSATLLSDEN